MSACLYCQHEAGAAGYHETCVPGRVPNGGVSLVAAEPRQPAAYDRRSSVSLACPKCRSENVRSVQIAYLAGTSTLTGSGGGIGLSLGGIGVGGGSFRGTQTTALARSIAPPRRSSVVGLLLLGWALGGFVFMGLNTVLVLWASLGICVGVPIVLAIFLSRANEREWRRAYMAWSSRFLCDRCGAVFVPLADAP